MIAAAGRGERAGPQDRPKQFRNIAGIPMLLRSIRPFAKHPRVREIVVCLPAAAVSDPPDWLADLVGERLRLVAGGDSRAASVARGVAALSSECTIVLVHDGARPFVSQETVDAVVSCAAEGTCAVAAVPVRDTVKRSAPDGRQVLETVAREGLWRAQTPQGFPRHALEQVYAAGANATSDATDEAALVEAAGFSVELVHDSTTNIKVTTPEDFVIAEALAAR